MFKIDYLGFVSNSMRTLIIPQGLSFLKIPSYHLYTHDGKRLRVKKYLFFDIMEHSLLKVEDGSLKKIKEGRANYYNKLLFQYDKNSGRWNISESSPNWKIFTDLRLFDCEQSYTLHLLPLLLTNGSSVSFSTVICNGRLNPFSLYCDFNKGSFAIDPPGVYFIIISITPPRYTVSSHIMGNDVWNAAVIEKDGRVKVRENEEFIIVMEKESFVSGTVKVTRLE